MSASRAVAAILVAVALARLLDAAAPATLLAPLPGAAPYPAELAARLQRAAARPRAVAPRTHHRNPDGSPRYTNRLILERSPYLLQHAHNPVDWYPWGDEAFERARREQKPVLLSIGYSTCHWCHVMEEESFDDEEIAAYLNAHYVAIKVDREQRPDVDGVYMAAVQRLTGGGGWPLTLWLTPDRHPFYGGTYYPPRDGARGVRVGFRTLLERLHAVYRERGAEAREAGADLAAEIADAAQTSPSSGLPTTQSLLLGYAHARNTFDSANGGFGRAPKFPRPATLTFLLRYHRRSGNATALDMVLRTLDAMARGGIYDHVGGGFHRYATDAAWQIPHFEKMLYDNAQLVVAYLEAYQATGDAAWAEVARDTLRYVEREMTSPEGGFYAASDADSEGVEGKFFVWTPAEIAAAVGADDAAWVNAYYGVTASGNFEGKNVLTVARPLDQVARDHGIGEETAAQRLTGARTRLYAARQRRVAPHTDHKIVTGWNGLMISAFARAAAVLSEPRYAHSAEQAATLILSHAQRGDRLPRSIVDREPGGTGYLDDYAFFIAALLDCFETSHQRHWLEQAVSLQRQLDERFRDAHGGGYFFTAHDQENLIAREKPSYDGSEPSGNSVALHNLMRLYTLTSDEAYRARAEGGLRQFERTLMRSPGSVPFMLAALDFYTDKAKEIVIAVPHDVAEAEPFLAKRAATFLPNSVVAVVRAADDREALAALVPLVADKEARNGRATAYVCERRVCDLPTSDPEVFAQQLAKVEPIPDSDKDTAVAEGHGGMSQR